MALKVGELFASLSLDTRQFDTSLSISESTFKGLRNTIIKGAAVIAGADLGKTGIEYNASIEQLQTSFEVMTGSAEKAETVMTEIKTLATKTPFSMEGLAETGVLLMNYGMGADEVVNAMRQLGDVAQGDQDKMTRLATAYGQMHSSGKVLLEDVKQMIEAGFNPLQEISDSTGESMQSLYGRISDGSITVDEITDSFKRSSSEGGKYFQSMEKQSQTFNGLMSTLGDTSSQLLGSIMTPVSEGLTTTLLPGAIAALEKMQTAFDAGGFAAVGQTIWTDIMTGIKTAMASGAAEGDSLLSGLLGMLNFENAEEAGAMAGEIVSALISSLVEKISETDFTAVVGAIGGALGAAASGLVDAAKGLAASLALYLLDADTWIGFGKAIINIVKGAFEGVKNFLKEFNEDAVEFTDAEGWAESALTTAQRYMDFLQKGAVSVETLVDMSFSAQKPTETQKALKQMLIDSGYVNESGEILDVPIIPNPVAATEASTGDGDAVTQIISQAVEGAKAEIEVPVEVSSVQAATLGDGAKKELGSAGTEAGQLFNSSLGTALANTSGVSAALAQIATTVRNQALGLSAHGTIGGKMFSAGLAAGIRSGQSAITSAARQVAKAAVLAANATLKIHSPSRVTFKTGGFFDKGFAKGILHDIPIVYKAAAQMANMAVGATSIGNPGAGWPTGSAVSGSRYSYIGATANEIAAAVSRVRFYVNGRDVSEAMSNDTAYTQNYRSDNLAARYGSI